MSVDSMTASRQWASRPEDQRFATVADLHAHALEKRAHARTATVAWSDLQVVPADDGDLLLRGPAGTAATFTNWSFTQLCRRIGAPADYLATLPAPLAADAVGHGLRSIGPDETPAMLFLSNGNGLRLRAATSEKYARIHDADLTSRLGRLLDLGWRVPPARPVYPGQKGTHPATEAECLGAAAAGLAIMPGDPIAPAGLYASDRDLWTILINPSDPIDDGAGKPLFKGLIVWNSEVGARTFGMSAILVEGICGNHILWGLRNVGEVEMRHVGSAADKAAAEMEMAVRTYATVDLRADATDMIRQARVNMIGEDKDAVLDRLFGLRIPGLRRHVLDLAYDMADAGEARYLAPPTSRWGMVNGLTEVAQTYGTQDARHAVDVAAGKILAIEF